MGFELLHSRLVAYVSHKVRNGEMTERGLARLTGVSQPHVHNVLKGVRLFSAQMADRVMEKLHVDVVALLGEEELGLRQPTAAAMTTDVPLLAGSLGPERPFPDLDLCRGSIPFLRADLDGLERPRAVRMAADAAVRHLFQANDLAVVEPLRFGRATTAVDFLAPDSYYAIDAGASGLIRRVERRGDRVLLRADQGATEPVSIPLGDRHILEVVRARVIWIGHYLERPQFAARPLEEAGGEDGRPGGEG